MVLGHRGMSWSGLGKSYNGFGIVLGIVWGRFAIVLKWFWVGIRTSRGAPERARVAMGRPLLPSCGFRETVGLGDCQLSATLAVGIFVCIPPALHGPENVSAHLPIRNLACSIPFFRSNLFPRERRCRRFA